MTDEALREAEHLAVGDGLRLKGYGKMDLFHDPDYDRPRNLWTPDEQSIFFNLITDAGDLYIANRVVAGLGPNAPSAPTAANGMKLGTGTTAAAKTGTGAALVTWLASSNISAFDTGYLNSNVIGGVSAGVEARYACTWGAGTSTNGALTEVVIVNDAATNATSSAANTYSRAVYTSINKISTDVLTCTWVWKFLGA
jgi:hypothetical protein